MPARDTVKADLSCDRTIVEESLLLEGKSNGSRLNVIAFGGLSSHCCTMLYQALRRLGRVRAQVRPSEEAL